MESILEEVKTLLKSNIKGDVWVYEALPTVININKGIKELEADKKKECEPFNTSLNEVRGKYAIPLAKLIAMDDSLRSRINKEYKGTETVRMDGVGQLIFPSSWGFEVRDISRVDKKYLSTVVDSKKVMEDVNNGVRKIRGLDIVLQRSLRVVPEKE